MASLSRFFHETVLALPSNKETIESILVEDSLNLH